MPSVIATAVTAVLGKGLVAAAVSSLLQVGAGLLLSKALAPKPPGGPEPEDGRVLFTRAVGDRVKRYGRNLVGGQLVFGRAGGAGNGPADTTPAAIADGEFLHRIVVHAHGAAAQVVEYRFDGRRRRVEPDGRVLSDEYIGTGSAAGSFLRVESRLGDVPQAPFAGVVDAAPDWGAAHRLDGLTCTWIRCQQRTAANQQATYPNGPTELQVLADFSLVRDPRLGTSVYTDNAALVIADWIESPEGFGVAGVLHEPDLIAAADRADVLRPLASGGSLPFWRLSGGASMAAAPEDALVQMLDACAGDIRMRPDGSWSINIGPDPEPVITLTEDDILELQELDDGPGVLDRYTTLPATYIDETLDYAETTMDSFVNEAEVTRIGTEVVGPSLDLKWAPYHAQARHAALIRQLRDNPARRARLVCRISALAALYERTVLLDAPAFGLSGAWRVEPFSMSLADMTVTLALSSVDIPRQVWSIAQEGAPLALPPELPDDDRPPAQPLAVQAFGNGSTGNAGVIAVFDLPDQPVPDVSQFVSVSPAGTDTWTAATVLSATSARLGGLTGGALYDVAVIAARAPATDPADPDVTSVIVRNVVAVENDPPPAVPTDLSVSNVGGGQALISVTAPVSQQQREIEILRGGVVVNRLPAVAGARLDVIDASGAGRFGWSARAVSLSGAVGPETVQVEQWIT